MRPDIITRVVQFFMPEAWQHLAGGFGASATTPPLEVNQELSFEELHGVPPGVFEDEMERGSMAASTKYVW
jgi:hypothetical protein